MASDDTAPAAQHRPRADIPALAAGFGSGLIVMTFGPDLAVLMIFGIFFPIVLLVIGSPLVVLAVARKSRRLRCFVEGLFASALFGLASVAVLFFGTH